MSAYKETKLHGTRGFPYIVYIGILPEYINGVQHHWHEEMEIIYVEKGRLIVSIGNTEYVLARNDIVLVHPQMIHAIQQYEKETSRYYNILFRFSMLESGTDDTCREKYLDPIYSRKVLMPEYLTEGDPLHKEIEPIIKELVTEPHHQRFNDELLIKSRVFEIMYRIFKHCDNADRVSEHEDIIHDKLKRSLSYLEEHYSENITVEEMATVSNYSESHFSKLFRQLTGDSFIQYLKKFRLESAAQRIVNEKTKISEIAVTCGFTNLSYFTRAFSEKFGMTPTQFRKHGVLMLQLK